MGGSSKDGSRTPASKDERSAHCRLHVRGAGQSCDVREKCHHSDGEPTLQPPDVRYRDVVQPSLPPDADFT